MKRHNSRPARPTRPARKFISPPYLNHAKSSLFLTDNKDWSGAPQAAQTLLDQAGGLNDSFACFLRATQVLKNCSVRARSC
jgi:hypothetical protein